MLRFKALKKYIIYIVFRNPQLNSLDPPKIELYTRTLIKIILIILSIELIKLYVPGG